MTVAQQLRRNPADAQSIFDALCRQGDAERAALGFPTPEEADRERGGFRAWLQRRQRQAAELEELLRR